LFTGALIDAEEGVGYVVDITEHKRTHAGFVESQERLRLVVDNASEYAILSTDLARRVTSWNRGAGVLLGYTEAEIIGNTADIIFTPEDRAQRACEMEADTALATGRAADERWHLRKDQSRFWGSGVMTPMHAESGEVIGFVKIFRDQTRQRQAQEALERSQRDLWNAVQEMERARQQADAARLAKDHFLAVLSHELRTPLTPALLVVQALSRRRDLPTGASEALEMVRRNIQIEAHLIDDLLDLTRIERGKIELTLEEADVHEALNHAIQTVCDDLGKKNQKAIVRLEASDSLILCDITRIQQVFWNILKNASKFSPQGATIVVESKNEAGQIHVIISDPGIGFNEDAAKRIFDAFQQADPEVSRKFGGLGLGLALSRAIVDGHGGEIVAESPGSGLGARFTVQLPIRSSEG
jgi:two-component system CheB/CheR fusion protein